MPRPKKTDDEIQFMREQILYTALVILQSDGAEAITSRAIAERLNVAHMSLFTYFKNQAEILDMLREREMAKWAAKQIGFEQRAQLEDVKQVVRELLEFYVSFARENPDLFRLAWVIPQATGESLEEERQRRKATVENLSRILHLGMEQGAFIKRDPFLAASTVLAMINVPNILFHSGKLVDINLRDQMVKEILFAAMKYLE